ncbi:tyrosine aminotransferase, tyrosine repressible [Salmonella enterica subsp. enterica]|uniref:Tyrosine aminotransferase, tyrosine repressible n=1 Tax=Salmonella enterica I TaxID=59201 RepID=A0A3S4IM80_SALET|nr:tyrosine aminotransferase, tyrosine repressible [Salmonella enterica subsp. enterica]
MRALKSGLGWRKVDAMRNRIISMRQTLVKELKAEMPDRNF